MLKPEAHVGIRCEMKHRITTSHGFRERRQIEIISASESEIRILLCGNDKLLLSGGKIIPPNHGKTFAQQHISEAAANESRHSRNENSFHAVAGKLNRSPPVLQALEPISHPCRIFLFADVLMFCYSKCE